MYKVELTTKMTYQHIKSFKVWDEDENYFIFYWGGDENIVIKKDYIISIRKVS
tara:strand:- start:82 stop:240 length:159 start_codon:yes stop_codon:yes gene_type:complete